MPLDINNAAPVGNQSLDTPGVMPDGSALPVQQPLLAKGSTPVIPDAEAQPVSNGQLSGISSEKMAAIRASNVGSIYAAMPGGEVGSSTPTLPMAKATAAGAQEASQALSNMPVNGILAFQLMREAGEKTFDLERKVNTTLQTGQLGAMGASVKAAIQKVEGDMKSSVTKFIGGLAGAGLSFGMGMKGSGLLGNSSKVEKNATGAATAAKPAVETMAASVDKRVDILAAARQKATAAKQQASISDGSTQAKGGLLSPEEELKDQSKKSRETRKTANGDTGRQDPLMNAALPTSAQNAASNAGMTAAAQSAGGVLSAATDALDKNIGGAHESSMADIESKNQDLLQTAFKMSLEGHKDLRDKSAKQVEDAIGALKTHFDLIKSTNDRI